MNSRVVLAASIIFWPAVFSMEEASDLTLADFRPFIAESEIKNKIIETAQKLFSDYGGHKTLTIVMIMKGAVHLASDLSRTLRQIPGWCGAGIPSTLEFIQASSYGQNGTQSGKLTLYGLDKLNLAAKDVLLVDDIFDTGQTIEAVKNELLKLKPASLKTLVLLTKEKKRQVTQLPDYSLFTIGDQFVVGYGLDYKEKYRELPDIWVKKD